jgi:glyoxylate/hydroxypyruvate reductase A
MKPSVLVATKGSGSWAPQLWAERIQPLLPERIILTTNAKGIYEGPEVSLREVHYALVWKPKQETLDRLPSLKAILSLGAGVDHIFSLTRLPDVPITRIVDRDLTMRMTEYVVWQVLDQLRRGPAYRRLQREGRWHEYEQPAAGHVTVGLMGLGIMGQDAAEVLLRLGFQVRGWARTKKDVEGVETFAGAGALDTFLSGTDILVSLLPLTPETRNFIDLNLLRKLRRDGPLGGPVLINAGRGGSQVEADIAEALRDGTLVGAGLDVFQAEPLPPDSALWHFDDLTITPHVAGVSDAEALARQIAEQIEAFERGEPLRNRVERERGY